MTRMLLIPIRCFTCGRVVASDWEQFKMRSDDGEDPNEILDSMGMLRYCCRRMLVGHVDV